MVAPHPDTGDFSISTDETIRMEARRLGVIGFTAVLLLLGGLAVVSYYAWHLDGELFGIVGMVLFLVIGLALIVLRIMQNRQGTAGVFILSPDGISVPGLNEQLVPWSEVTDISTMNIRGSRFISLVVTDKAKESIGRSKILTGINKVGENFGIKGDISIAASQIPIALGEFIVLLAVYAADHSKQSWAAEMLEELMKSQQDQTAAV